MQTTLDLIGADFHGVMQRKDELYLLAAVPVTVEVAKLYLEAVKAQGGMRRPTYYADGDFSVLFRWPMCWVSDEDAMQPPSGVTGILGQLSSRVRAGSCEGGDV